MHIEFTVWGDPVPQLRPRFARAGKFVKTYDPKPSREYKAYVKMMAANVKPLELLSGPLEFDLDVYKRMPKSLTKKRREAAENKKLRPTTKPDADNYFKCVSDALTGIIYKDDNQIVDVQIKKYYSSKPKVVIKIKELEAI